MSNTFTQTDNGLITGKPTVQRSLPFLVGMMAFGANGNLKTLKDHGWFPYRREITHDPEDEAIGHRVEDTGETVHYRELELVTDDEGNESWQWVEKSYEKQVLVETVFQPDPVIAVAEREAVRQALKAEIKKACDFAGIRIPRDEMETQALLEPVAVQSPGKRLDAMETSLRLLGMGRAVTNAGFRWAEVVNDEETEA